MSSMPRPEYQKKNITSGATTAVFTGKGLLHTVTVNTTAAGTIILQDEGVTFATIVSNVLPQTFIYDVTIASGLTVVTAAASDVTISYGNY